MKKIHYFSTKTIIIKDDPELGTLYLALAFFAPGGRMATLFSKDVRESIFLDQLDASFVFELKHDKSLTFQQVKIEVESNESF